jgi:hypothetical protein
VSDRSLLTTVLVAAHVPEAVPEARMARRRVRAARHADQDGRRPDVRGMLLPLTFQPPLGSSVIARQPFGECAGAMAIVRPSARTSMLARTLFLLNVPMKRQRTEANGTLLQRVNG